MRFSEGLVTIREITCEWTLARMRADVNGERRCMCEPLGASFKLAGIGPLSSVYADMLIEVRSGVESFVASFECACESSDLPITVPVDRPIGDAPPFQLWRKHVHSRHVRHHFWHQKAPVVAWNFP